MDESTKSTIMGVLTVVIILSLIAGVIVLFNGLGSKRGQSQYTGHVVDVAEDKGVVFTPDWAVMKTDPRSSDKQTFCIRPEDGSELLPQFYSAMESGDRFTVTYHRPLFVWPDTCRSQDAIVTDIRAVNASQ